jgi:aspartokinase/homoserine dehydrogenase 1
LGRGGSDYTAAIFGSALNAEEIEIWTDVNGMMTADPRMVKKAFSLPELSYTEAMELSFFGAKVIYPPTMIPAFMKKIPIVIRNTFEPEFPGSVIKHDCENSGLAIKGNFFN